MKSNTLNTLEKLEDFAQQNHITVIPYHFDSDRIRGLYCDGTVALSDSIDTTAEKICILAEELGHHYTTSGNIINQAHSSNRKQERKARLWAYHRTLDLIDLISAYKYGCRNRYEIADYLEVTECFLQEALDTYKEKYGMCTTVDKYVVYFDPLIVLELIIK